MGVVTSGSFSPALATAIRLGYVSGEPGATGARVEVEARDTMVPVEVVELPFYTRKPPQGSKEAS